MEKQKTFYSEAAYALGLIALAFGVALMEKADFGMSMVVAPAYLLHLKLQTVWPWFTFGMAEYALQAVLLLVMTVVLRRARLGYLFSFLTAVLYGLTLDLVMLLLGAWAADGLVWRVIFYLIGMVFCSAGVSLLFHTYIAPEAYELFVKEISKKYGFAIHRVKTVYDCCSCAVGIALSFAFFGLWHFEGVKLGTVVCALVNGWMIGRFNRWLDRTFAFCDAFPLRRWFE